MRRMASSPLSVGKAGTPTPTAPLPHGPQGPIRATQAFGLTAHGPPPPITHDGLIPLLKTKRSSDRLQAGSPQRERKTGGDGGPGIRKSRSVDAVTSNCYLNGEWPRADSLVAQAYFCPSNLTSDRATQTPQEWCHLRSSKSLKSESLSMRSVSVSGGDSLKTIRACLTRSGRESAVRQGSSGFQQTVPMLCSHHGFNGIGLALPSKPMAIPDLQRNRTHVHGSPDGLSQEIEKLAMTVNASFSDDIKMSLDGRCAPIAKQLRMCSVVTQTPSQFVLTRENLERDTLTTTLEVENVNRQDHLVQGTNSPELVRFASPHALTDRLAPEGCEKVCGKFSEISKVIELTVEIPSPLKMPSSGICHIPSESSAFNPPLVKNYLTQTTQMAKKISSASIND